jgi:hypothetical protein
MLRNIELFSEKKDGDEMKFVEHGISPSHLSSTRKEVRGA